MGAESVNRSAKEDVEASKAVLRALSGRATRGEPTASRASVADSNAFWIVAAATAYSLDTFLTQFNRETGGADGPTIDDEGAPLSSFVAFAGFSPFSFLLAGDAASAATSAGGADAVEPWRRRL